MTILAAVAGTPAKIFDVNDSNSVELVVCCVISEVTNSTDIISKTSELAISGISSMTTIIVVVEIKKIYLSVMLRVQYFFECNTVQDLIELIELRLHDGQEDVNDTVHSFIMTRASSYTSLTTLSNSMHGKDAVVNL